MKKKLETVEEIRFPTDGTAKLVETVIIETLHEYELDGKIDNVIKTLRHYEAEGKKLGLTNIRVCTDSEYVDHSEPKYGGGWTSESKEVWTTVIKGDK